MIEALSSSSLLQEGPSRRPKGAACQGQAAAARSGAAQDGERQTELARSDNHCINFTRTCLLGVCMQAQDEEAQRERTAKLAARTAAIQGLEDMVGEPHDLWQAAVQLATTYTSASGEPSSHITSAHSKHKLC